MKLKHTGPTCRPNKAAELYLYLIQAMEVTTDLFCSLVGFAKKGIYSASGRPRETIKEQGSDQRDSCAVCHIQRAKH